MRDNLPLERTAFGVRSSSRWAAQTMRSIWKYAMFKVVALAAATIVAVNASAAPASEASICVEALAKKDQVVPPLQVGDDLFLQPIAGARTCIAVVPGRYVIKPKNSSSSESQWFNYRVDAGETAELVFCQSTLLARKPEWRMTLASRKSECNQ